jgi:hypothetical protein
MGSLERSTNFMGILCFVWDKGCMSSRFSNFTKLISNLCILLDMTYTST